VKFLQDRFVYFYPENRDIVNRMQALALELGGVLSPPPLKRKYQWVQTIFGSHNARRARMACPRVKVFAMRRWDQCLFIASNRVERHQLKPNKLRIHERR
jgi:hypothetical protein